MPALPLSPEQLADATRLKAIYTAKKRELGLTQESLASACGWESQGTVSQYFNGKIPLNVEAAVKFANELCCSVADFSPRLAAELAQLRDPYHAQQPTAGDQKKSKIEPVHIEEAANLRRIFDARPSPRLSQAKFGDEHGIGTQGVVWQYLNARIPLNVEQAVRFAKGLGCSVADFSPRLAAELAQLRDPHHAQQPTAGDLPPSSNIPHGQSPLESNVSPGPDVRGRVPLISWVQAGVWNEAVDIYEPGYAEDWLPVLRNGSPHSYALRVQGDSMTAPHGRSYPEGTIIIVDPEQRSPSSGQRIIAKLVGTNAVTFKVFVDEDGKRWLKPLNPLHEPIRDEFRVLGTVIAKYEAE